MEVTPEVDVLHGRVDDVVHDDPVGVSVEDQVPHGDVVAVDARQEADVGEGGDVVDLVRGADDVVDPVPVHQVRGVDVVVELVGAYLARRGLGPEL